jgi:hypothetical protein
VRLISGTLLAGLLLWRRLLLVHRWLPITLRWWRILAWLLRWVRRLAAIAMLRQRLTIRAVELRVGWWTLTAPDGVGRHEGLRLRVNWCEDAFLGEADAVGAATILGLIEAGAADLSHVSEKKKRALQFKNHTLRRRQYRHAMAVRCLGAGWTGA